MGCTQGRKPTSNNPLQMEEKPKGSPEKEVRA